MISLLKYTVLVGAFCACAFGQQIPASSASGARCGDPVQGIELCLSNAAEKSNLAVELKNVGTSDEFLNLGYIVGSRQYPNAIALVFDEAKRNPFIIELAGPALIAGHVASMGVPLPVGASLKLPIRFTNEMFGNGYFIELTESHTLRVRFDSKAADSFKESSLVPSWKGTAFSNTLTVGPTRTDKN